MRDVFKGLSDLKKKIKKRNVILLLDFDLTLAPLAKNPDKASLPKTTKGLLKKIVSQIPAVIISGRKLSDIKKRVNIKGVRYVGNHGLEHNLNKKYEAVPVPLPVKKALSRTKRELIKKCRKFRGVVFEDKKYSMALGYRMVGKKDLRSLQIIFKKVSEDIKKEGLLETRLEKKTFEVRPRMNVNKGVACLLALKIIQKKLHRKIMPVYIGDGQTDEDAFIALKRVGITIRVGKNKKSAAKWYVENQREVNLFLSWLVSQSNY